MPRHRMRICLFAPADSVHTSRWVEGLAERGNEVIYLNISGRPQEFGAGSSIDVNGGTALLSRLRRFWRRRAIVRELRPDIVHQHSVPATPGNATFWRMPRLVVSSWGTDVMASRGRLPLAAVWQRFLLAQAARITATSQFLAAETTRLAPRDADISIIPFGVDCETFSPERHGRLRPEDSVTIGFVKHLEPKYGPEQLLRAFGRISKRHRDTRLLMVGSGSLRSRLERLAEELGVSSRVRFLGAVPHREVPFVLAGLSVFVMPSVSQESFGVAAVEASAMEVPVVATRVGGVPEVVLDGETGLLVPPNDVNALEGAIERLIEDRKMREELGRRGRKWVVSRYTWEGSVSAMQELYSGVRGKGGA